MATYGDWRQRDRAKKSILYCSAQRLPCFLAGSVVLFLFVTYYGNPGGLGDKVAGTNWRQRGSNVCRRLLRGQSRFWLVKVLFSGQSEVKEVRIRSEMPLCVGACMFILISRSSKNSVPLQARHFSAATSVAGNLFTLVTALSPCPALRQAVKLLAGIWKRRKLLKLRWTVSSCP